MTASPRHATPTRHAPPWWFVACAAAYIGYFLLLAWCEIHRPEPPGLTVRFDGGDMIVASVTPDSPAARAGLQPDDAIVSVNNHRLRSRLDWLLAAANVEPNQKIAARIRRGNQTLDEGWIVLPPARPQYWLTVEGLTHGAVRLLSLIHISEPTRPY